MTDRASRATIDGPEPLIVESGDAPRGLADGRAHRGVAVRPVAGTPTDRAEGRRRFEVSVDGWLFQGSVEPARRAMLRDRVARASAAAGHHAPVVLRAQIPGRIARVWVEAGESVESAQRLLAVEAMKMENEVRAPRSGTVDAVHVSVGQTIESGGELVTLG